MRTLTALVLGALLAATAVSALATPPAILRQEIVSQNGRVTLGDLFYDAGDASGVLVARVSPGQSAVLDATQVQILARSSGVNWGNPQDLRRIVVEPGAVAPAAPSPKKPRTASVLAYLHNINTGEIVRAEDLTWSKEAVETPDTPRDPQAVIGLAARHPLREGAAASLRDLTAPTVIKKDDLIVVAFNLDGVSLTLQAKALENAVPGQAFTAINPNSKKVIQAVATGLDTAVVKLDLDSPRSNPSRLALR